MTMAADQYKLVIGVDTHAASDTLSIITTAPGAVDAQASFPANLTGLDRARAWITRCAASRPSLVVVEGIGSHVASLADRVLAAGLLMVEPATMAAADRQGSG